MTPKELRSKKDKDLQGFLSKWKEELAGLKVQAAIGQCANPSRIMVLKRDIARLKTVMNERSAHAGTESE